MTDSILSLITTKIQKEHRFTSDNVETLKQLIEEIQELRNQQEKVYEELDQSLQFYYQNIHPEENALLSAFSERIKSFYHFYKNQKCLSEEETSLFKKLLAEEINNLYSMVGFYRISSEIKEIFKELNEEDYKKAAQKEEEKMQEADSASQNEASEESLNNKNQDPQKEMMRREFKEMEKKSLSNIYKRLAKAIHPDLELSDDQKEWKGELMKKVTCAYENKDLYELLALEMELMSHSNSEKASDTGEQINIYNSILKDEIELLKKNISQAISNPRYNPIRRFYKNPAAGRFHMTLEARLLKTKVDELQTFVNRLQTPEAELIYKAVIKEYTNRLN